MGRPCCCDCSVQVEKLHKNTGRVIWRSSIIPSTSAAAYNIRPLSDGSFVVGAGPGLLTSPGTLYRISSDGLSILYSLASSCLDSYETEGYVPRLVVNGSGNRIYASLKGSITCYDTTLSTVWTQTFSSAFAPYIYWYNNTLYSIGIGAVNSRLDTFNDATGATILVNVGLTGGPPFFVPEGIKLQEVNSLGIYGIVSSGGAGNARFPLTGGAVLGSGWGVIGANKAFRVNDSLAMMFGPNGTSTNKFNKVDATVPGAAATWSATYAGAIGIRAIDFLGDGGIVCAGVNLSGPVCDGDTTASHANEKKNAICFNSDGSVRWTSSQTDEILGLSPAPSAPYEDGGHFGVCVAADDGHPVFTSRAFPCATKPVPLCLINYGDGPCGSDYCDFTVTGSPGSYSWVNSHPCSICGCPYTVASVTSTFGAPTDPTEILEFYCQ